MTTQNGARLRTLARVSSAAIVVASLVAACGSSSKAGTTAGSGAPTTSAGTSAASGGGATAASGGTITIKNFKFSDLTVKAGAKVTVVNDDQAPHTVTGGGSSGFDTGMVQGGSSASFTAPTTPGTYDFICSVHPYMHGTLVVTG